MNKVTTTQMSFALIWKNIKKNCVKASLNQIFGLYNEECVQNGLWEADGGYQKIQVET